MATLAGVIDDPLFTIWLNNKKTLHSAPATNTKLIIHSLHSSQWAAKTFKDLLLSDGQNFWGMKRGPTTDQPLYFRFS